MRRHAGFRIFLHALFNRMAAREVFMHKSAAREDNMSEFSFTATVRGFHVYCRVWLPHVGLCVSAEREHGNVNDGSAIAVREQDDTRADEVRLLVFFITLIIRASTILVIQQSL